MPKIRRKRLPANLLNHLLDRIDERQITEQQLTELANWLSTDPEVPEGKWYKNFSGMTVCGEGELVRTFLLRAQVADGQEVE